MSDEIELLANIDERLRVANTIGDIANSNRITAIALLFLCGLLLSAIFGCAFAIAEDVDAIRKIHEQRTAANR